jgi:hypothetical protein
MGLDLVVGIISGVIASLIVAFLLKECGPFDHCPKEYNLTIIDTRYETPGGGAMNYLRFTVHNRASTPYDQCAVYLQIADKTGLTRITPENERFSIAPGTKQITHAFRYDNTGTYEATHWVWCFSGDYNPKYFGGHPGASDRITQSFSIP